MFQDENVWAWSLTLKDSHAKIPWERECKWSWGGFWDPKMHFRSVISVPPSVPCRPPVPPTARSDLALLFSFSAFFFWREWLFYLSLLTLSLIKGPKCGVCVWSGVSDSLWPHGYSPPGPSVHGLLQAIKLERVAISFSRGSSWPTGRAHISWVSCIGRWILLPWSHLGSPKGTEDVKDKC